jgi:hypothetical protein
MPGVMICAVLGEAREVIYGIIEGAKITRGYNRERQARLYVVIEMVGVRVASRPRSRRKAAKVVGLVSTDTSCRVRVKQVHLELATNSVGVSSTLINFNTINTQP